MLILAKTEWPLHLRGKVVALGILEVVLKLLYRCTPKIFDVFFGEKHIFGCIEKQIVLKGQGVGITEASGNGCL